MRYVMDTQWTIDPLHRRDPMYDAYAIISLEILIFHEKL